MFFSTHLQVRPLKGFLRLIPQTIGSAQESAILGLENYNLIFTSAKEVSFLPDFVCLSVCLSLC